MTKLYFIFLLCALTSAGAKDASGLRHSAYGASGGASQDSGTYGSQSNLNHASYKTDSASGGSGSPSGYSDPGASSSYSGISSPSGYTGSVASRGYSGSSSYTESSSTSGQDSSVDYSGTASKSGYSGSGSNSAETHQQDYSGTTRTLAYTDKDHNGLSENEVSELVAAANRRRLQRLFYTTPSRARPLAPKRYGSLPPRYYSNLPLYGRSGEGAASDLASNYASSGTDTGSSYGVATRQLPDSSYNAGSGYGSDANENNANREGQQGYQSGTSGANSDSSESNQNAAQESSRRFYLPNSYGINPYHPYPTNNNPLNPFADLNNQNYLNAFGPYGK